MVTKDEVRKDEVRKDGAGAAADGGSRARRKRWHRRSPPWSAAGHRSGSSSGTGVPSVPTMPVGTIVVHSPDALRRIVWAPGELGIARAFVAGDLSVEGDIFEVLRALRDASPGTCAPSTPGHWQPSVRTARRLGVLRSPLPAPPEESRPTGRIHSPSRDARAVSHHYDVGNDFYELVLGPSWTYSCARFVTPATTLEEAQAAKYELICREARPRRATGIAAARRGVRMGVDGHPRRQAPRGRGGRHRPQPPSRSTRRASGSATPGSRT